MEKIDKAEIEMKNVELANLTHTAGELAKLNLDALSQDASLKELCLKARSYLDLILDDAIKRYKGNYKS